MEGSRPLGPKLFTVEAAQALLPLIRDRLSAFRAYRAQYDACRRELLVLRMVSSSGAAESSSDARALSEMEAREASLLKSMEQVQLDLLRSGCVPKSLRQGLVDFFALKDGCLVFLCWREGEDRIEAWHTLEGGFAGRQPLASFGPDGDSGER